MTQTTIRNNVREHNGPVIQQVYHK